MRGVAESGANRVVLGCGTLMGSLEVYHVVDPILRIGRLLEAVKSGLPTSILHEIYFAKSRYLG